MFPYYIAKNIFLADLIQKTISLPQYIYLPLFIINGLIIWLISKLLIKSKYVFVPVLIYFLSPWGYYLTISRSFYVFLLFAVLATIYGLILIVKGKKIIGSVSLIFGSLILLYSSSLFLILLPIILTLLIIFKIVPLKNIKTTIFPLALLTIPLLVLIMKNTTALKNIFAGEINIFSDPGLINTVNRYQGAAAEHGLKNLSRISENKYIFFGEYFALKYSTQLMPMTYFTPQYKLLNFSFSPPLFLGFLIPFFYGLYKLIGNSKVRTILLISTILVVPSVLSEGMVSLNRLLVFFQIIIAVISYGLIYLYEDRKNIVKKVFIILTLMLLVFQIAVTILDIKNLEIIRSQKYLEGKYELTE